MCGACRLPLWRAQIEACLRWGGVTARSSVPERPSVSGPLAILPRPQSSLAVQGDARGCWGSVAGAPSTVWASSGLLSGRRSRWAHLVRACIPCAPGPGLRPPEGPAPRAHLPRHAAFPSPPALSPDSGSGGSGSWGPLCHCAREPAAHLAPAPTTQLSSVTPACSSALPCCAGDRAASNTALTSCPHLQGARGRTHLWARP